MDTLNLEKDMKQSYVIYQTINRPSITYQTIGYPFSDNLIFLYKFNHVFVFKDPFSLECKFIKQVML